MPTIRLLDFLLLNIILLLSSFLIVSIFNREKLISSGKIFLCITTVFFSQIILVEVFLGSLSILNYKNLAISISFIFILLLCLIIHKKIKIPKIEKPKKIPKIFTALIFSPLIILLIGRLGKAILEIPMEYDSLAYHLPFVVKWLQTSSILQPYFTAFAGPIGYYPSNFELITLFTVLPLHNDFLSTFINFLLYIPVSICLYCVFRNFKIKKALSLTLTAALLYMPVFVTQTGAQLADLFFVLTFLLSIFFIQENQKKYSHLNSLLFGLSIGLFLGTKYLAIPYAILPVIIFIALNFKFKKILIFALGTFLTGSFFYFRNLFFTGNPIFPAELQIFGIKIFEGFGNLNEQLKNSSILSNFNIETIKKVFLATYQNMGYQGVFLRLFIPISVLFLIYKGARKKHFSNKQKLLLLSLVTCVFFALVYLSAPNTSIHIVQNTRYALPLFIVVAIATGLLISHAKKLQKTFILIILLTTAQTFFTFNSLNLPEFSYKKLANFYPERENNFKDSAQKWYGDNPKLLSLMEATNWLNQNAPNAEIAYAGFNLHYHLYGRKLDRKVDYININECLNCDYFDFKNTPDGIRSNPDFTAWLKNLRAKDKSYLIVDREPESGSKMYELEWAQQYSKIFQPVFNQGSFHVFKID